MKRIGAVAVMAVFVLAACGSRGSGTGEDASEDSGIRGIVVIGPQCPVVVQGSPCPDQPFEADIRVLDSHGDVVTTVRSGEDGRFEVALPPGRYVLDPVAPTPGGLPFGKQVTVRVPPHEFVKATVAFDTGIR